LGAVLLIFGEEQVQLRKKEKERKKEGEDREREDIGAKLSRRAVGKDGKDGPRRAVGKDGPRKGLEGLDGPGRP
jgi:hypothetical protein